MVIHSLSGTDTMNDLRFAVKRMAHLLSMRDLRGGTVPMRKLTTKVLEGDILLAELQEWYPHAVNRLRKTN